MGESEDQHFVLTAIYILVSICLLLYAVIIIGATCIRLLDICLFFAAHSCQNIQQNIRHWRRRFPVHPVIVIDSVPEATVTVRITPCIVTVRSVQDAVVVRLDDE